MKKILLLIVVITTIIMALFFIRDNKSYNEIKGCLSNQNNCNFKIRTSPKLQKILNNLKYPDQFVKPNDLSKIVVINFAGGLGDEFAALRMKTAAENLGWEPVIIGWADKAPSLNAKMIQFLKPEFVISQYPLGIAEGVPNYLILHSPPNNTNDFNDKYLNYDGLLLSFGDDRFIKPLQDFFALNNKTLNYQYFYFSVSKKQSKFRELDYFKLFYSGDRWDKRRGEDYSKLYKLMDQAGYFTVYGPENSWKDYPNSYKGFLPFEESTYLEAIRNSGVSLVVHSKGHYNNNFPSGRIFEALASSTIIISDDMKFVKDNFSNNILYIDPSLPPEKLFLQIDNHMQWIKSNPLKAKEMAKNANKIFQEKFVLENLLLNVEKMHNKIKSTK